MIMKNRFLHKKVGGKRQQRRQDEDDSAGVMAQSTSTSWAYGMDQSELKKMTMTDESATTTTHSSSSSSSNQLLIRNLTDGKFSKEGYMDIAHAMEQNLEVKDRKYHLKTYEDCFVGREAIDFLVDYLQLSSREEALRIGQQMNLNACRGGIWEHVVHDHNDQLKDDYLFYRFTTQYYNQRQSTFTLEEIMRSFQLGVRTSDRTYHLKTYRNVFVGKEAIDFLLKYKFASTRVAALELGRLLEKEYNLFVHVTGEHQLKDEYIFYRMLTPKNIGKSKKRSDKELQKQALQQWICIFTIVAMILYYYLF